MAAFVFLPYTVNVRSNCPTILIIIMLISALLNKNKKIVDKNNDVELTRLSSLTSLTCGRHLHDMLLSDPHEPQAQAKGGDARRNIFSRLQCSLSKESDYEKLFMSMTNDP